MPKDEDDTLYLTHVEDNRVYDYGGPIYGQEPSVSMVVLDQSTREQLEKNLLDHVPEEIQNRVETIMKKKPSLVVDFDGVICEHRFPDVGDPTEGVQEALETLQKAGYRIVIHSCRTSFKFKSLLIGDQFDRIKEYMKYYKLPFDKFRKACKSFFRQIKRYKKDLTSLLTENFQIISSNT